ncbi:MAG: hypothetical protein AB3N28_03690 [Kordiimonas sp.]
MKLLSIPLILACSLSASANESEFSSHYFGITPPDTTPIEFPFDRFVPEGFAVGNPTFAPDGKEFYFTETNSMQIHIMKRTPEGWSKPQKASFATEGRNYEPFITKDNARIYFVSTRAPGSGKWNGRIWTCERKPDGSWSEPSIVIDRATEEGFWFPTSPKPDTLYFGATLEDSLGEGDFYKATKVNGIWSIKHLEPPFNTPDYEWDPLVSPNGSYMIFESRRPEGYGATDIYVTFRKEDDTWGDPINLGRPVNSTDYETAASITPDGAYMFYTLAPDEGKPSVHWVSTKVITRLKPE